MFNSGSDELAEMPIEDLSKYLKEKGRGRFAEPERLAKSIQKAIKGSYRLSTVVQNSIDVILSVYVTEIRTLEKQIKILEKAIEKLMKTIEESKILQSIPGIGRVYAAGIIAEIGQIERFENQAKLAKYAGLTWK
jgi:Transposase and inactivated derivatives